VPRLPRSRRSRLLALLGAAAVVVVAVVVPLAGSAGGATAHTVRAVRLPVTDGPGRTDTVTVDADLYAPTAAGRHPAVVLSHGFGGDKSDVASQARRLADAGYVVLAPSARGFGASTGGIGLDLPQYDVTDASQEIDYLATLPNVQLDAPGDPRVGFAGASYGGGISLDTAARDPRIDAVAAVITWNSLASALSPNAADPAGGRPGGTVGVFKQLYAGTLFASGASLPGAAPRPCGRFVAEVCAAYSSTASSGQASPAALATLDQAGVAPVVGALRVPTLLVQGEADSLFPLDEAVRTYTALRGAGVPVAMDWADGGHDSPFGTAEQRRIEDRTLAWFGRYLGRNTSVDVGPGFRWHTDGGSRGSTAHAQAAAFPVAGTRGTTYTLGVGGALSSGGPVGTGYAVNPPGGRPAQITSLPGLPQLSQAAGALGALGGGADAVWTSPALTTQLQLVGTPTVRVHVASTSGTAVLFAALYDVDASGTSLLPYAQVAPLRVVGAGGAGTDVTVALPTLAHTFLPGHRLRLSFAATDFAYAPEPAAAVVAVSGVAGSGLTLPTVTVPGSGGSLLPLGIGIAALVAVVAAAVGRVLTVRRRHAASRHTGTPDATPVVVRGLTKTYPDGHHAVEDVSFTVERGTVVGLLGPNGAGKTTTLRMMLGLINATAGQTHLFGERVTPSHPVLSRVGTFVEGPGLLPHLSGRDNLLLWWRSTGADIADAKLEEALEVAGLGVAIDRPVRSYSQGMRQRVALAQALLGMPDLLILDEPTNGLDPPQIREMRELIQRYAATGRTVLLSSHLLSEVEVTCTDVVVMQSGRLVYTGAVAELLGQASSLRVDTDDPRRALEVLRGTPGVRSVAPGIGSDAHVLTVDADPAARPDIVVALVAAGIGVREVAVQRRLEDVFLSLVGAAETGHSIGSGGGLGSYERELDETAGRR
jgi:ABC-2 type transport system ATP-binding protein